MQAHNDEFVKSYIPAIRRRAVFVLGNCTDRGRREEIIQAAVCLAWKAYRDLVRSGRRDRAFPSALAMFSVRQAMAQRDIARPLNTRDVMALEARHKHSFECELLEPGVWDRQSSVPERVAFRLDYKAWIESLGDRVRAIAEHLAAGWSTQDAAKRFGLSPARISQLRRQLAESWSQFHEPASVAG